ncbi:hypothetical protein C8046_11915 [Serinibacter arcticus]|uniref:Uncharacterized protein n=1 Tax=Serinibacter arcticus TaxID=1655435 RepID=A0A2U1ZW88_9MICO|nr:hypothetical protein C8046_11915 [Serinibacter arcticus]
MPTGRSATLWRRAWRKPWQTGVLAGVTGAVVTAAVLAVATFPDVRPALAAAAVVAPAFILLGVVAAVVTARRQRRRWTPSDRLAEFAAVNGLQPEPDPHASLLPPAVTAPPAAATEARPAPRDVRHVLVVRGIVQGRAFVIGTRTSRSGAPGADAVQHLRWAAITRDPTLELPEQGWDTFVAGCRELLGEGELLVDHGDRWITVGLDDDDARSLRRVRSLVVAIDLLLGLEDAIEPTDAPVAE